ncbi:MAG: hypothetical protein ACRD0U_05410 [Acidimicrobiales bacterium]
MEPAVEDALRVARSYAADGLEYASRVLADVSAMLRDAGETTPAGEPEPPEPDTATA